MLICKHICILHTYKCAILAVMEVSLVHLTKGRDGMKGKGWIKLHSKGKGASWPARVFPSLQTRILMRIFFSLLWEIKANFKKSSVQDDSLRNSLVSGWKKKRRDLISFSILGSEKGKYWDSLVKWFFKSYPRLGKSNLGNFKTYELQFAEYPGQLVHRS